MTHDERERLFDMLLAPENELIDIELEKLAEELKHVKEGKRMEWAFLRGGVFATQNKRGKIKW